jgi:hypothetical protein
MQILRAPAARGARNNGCYFCNPPSPVRMTLLGNTQYQSLIIEFQDSYLFLLNIFETLSNLTDDGRHPTPTKAVSSPGSFVS